MDFPSHIALWQMKRSVDWDARRFKCVQSFHWVESYCAQARACRWKRHTEIPWDVWLHRQVRNSACALSSLRQKHCNTCLKYAVATCWFPCMLQLHAMNHCLAEIRLPCHANSGGDLISQRFDLFSQQFWLHCTTQGVIYAWLHCTVSTKSLDIWIVLIYRHDMEANVTLHWFVHPKWFDDLGGWLNPDNVKYYVEWAQIAFKHFGQFLPRRHYITAFVHTWGDHRAI